MSRPYPAGPDRHDPRRFGPPPGGPTVRSAWTPERGAGPPHVGPRRATGPGPGSRPPYRQDIRPAYPRPAARPIPPLVEGEELIAGRRPVEEAFAARRPSLRLLVVPQRREALERLVLHAATLRIPVVEVEGGSLTALAGFDGHQGIALVVRPRVFVDPSAILARAIERGEPPFILVLDSLEDPQNVGTLLRSAEAAGVHGVIFPTARQAPLTPAAVKASAGATEHLLLAPVDDLAGALADLHIRGIRVVGSEADAAMTARTADLRGPLAIVVGSEGAGLTPSVRRRCDLMVRIPMRGVIGSLNAAVAGSILVFEAVAQRDDPASVPAPTASGVATAPAATPDPHEPSHAVRRTPVRRAATRASRSSPAPDGASPAGPAPQAPAPAPEPTDEGVLPGEPARSPRRAARRSAGA